MRIGEHSLNAKSFFYIIIPPTHTCKHTTQDLPSLSALSPRASDDSAGERDGGTLNAIGRYSLVIEILEPEEMVHCGETATQ